MFLSGSFVVVGLFERADGADLSDVGQAGDPSSVLGIAVTRAVCSEYRVLVERRPTGDASKLAVVLVNLNYYPDVVVWCAKGLPRVHGRCPSSSNTGSSGVQHSTWGWLVTTWKSVGLFRKEPPSFKVSAGGK